jgi:hypothetical protein
MEVLPWNGLPTCDPSQQRRCADSPIWRYVDIEMPEKDAHRHTPQEGERQTQMACFIVSPRPHFEISTNAFGGANPYTAQPTSMLNAYKTRYLIAEQFPKKQALSHNGTRIVHVGNNSFSSHLVKPSLANVSK